MKISKIYSNDNRFRDIIFNDGLNVILGKVRNKEALESSSHNLGKSTLVQLIDFMFLKEIKNGHFLKDNFSKFKNHVFFIELMIKEDFFITIKRSVKNNTKISIKTHENRNQDFRYENDWDFKDLPLTTKKEDKNPKHILNELWGFSRVLPYNYRKYINYFLRTQYDYDKVFKLSKYQGRDSEWKPYLATLMGFNGEMIKCKYELESEIKKEEQLLEEMEEELSVSINDLNKIQSMLNAKQKEKDRLLDKIDSFDFYFKERKLNKELVNEIEKQIAKLNTYEYNLKLEISQIKNALESKVEFNINKIKKLFKEVSIYFPEQLQREYRQLIQFNKQITEERNKYLFRNLEENRMKLVEVQKELNLLNNRRNEILSVLKEEDSFIKFKRYQLDLVQVENEINKLINKLDNMKVLEEIVNRKKKLIEQLEDCINDIKNNFIKGNKLFEEIQETFTELSNKILDETAIIYHTMNHSNNIEFKAKITSIDEDKITSKSDGYSYKKMLCVCYDLAVLKNYNTKNFFQFVYHDGSFESIGDTKKIKYLDTIREITKNDGIQYILTVLEDHIPRLSDGTLYGFSDEEIVITLDDRENDAGRLFGFSF